MSKEQTAVDFLIEQLTSIGHLEIPKGSNVVTSIIEQAKELEKQQQFEAYKHDNHYTLKKFKQYYNDKYNQ